MAAGPVSEMLVSALGGGHPVFLPLLDVALLVGAAFALGGLAGAWAGEGGHL
jgi:hypothetical protein